MRSEAVTDNKEVVPQQFPAPDVQDVTRLAHVQADPYLVLSPYVNADARTQDVRAMRRRTHSQLHTGQ